MKIIKIYFILLMISGMCKSQGIDNFWLLGYANSHGLPTGATNIDFNTGIPLAYYYPARKMELSATVGEIADSLGNLLFYTNGAWIANSHDSLMANGDSLTPSIYLNSHYKYGFIIPFGDMVLPYPGHPYKYVLFHETFNISTPFQPGKLYYTTINMNLNNGLGGVEKKIRYFSLTL